MSALCTTGEHAVGAVPGIGAQRVAGRELLLWLHLLFRTYEGARGLCRVMSLTLRSLREGVRPPQGSRAASRVLASAWSMSGPAGDGGACRFLQEAPSAVQ